jgi:mono/diheme cytochrome c family protein
MKSCAVTGLLSALLLVLPVLCAAAEGQPAATPELLARGKVLYERQCAACHGAEGHGDGGAAYLLYPKPRNFVSSDYRISSTWERRPTDEDLFNTITRGMPGSSMPPWDRLSEKDRWALVHYIKTFAQRPWPQDEAAPPPREGEKRGVIAVPPEPPYDDAARAQAAKLYAEGCAACHGATGRGDGQQVQIDQEGFPVRPRDLSRGIFKGSDAPEEVYRRIVGGIPGSPMPMSDWAEGDAAWHLTHFVLALSSASQREAQLARMKTIPVARVTQLPDHPDAAAWRNAERVSVQVMPLWWRDDHPEQVTVRALHDGTSIAIQMVWLDPTHDHLAIRTEDFRDAAAVQFYPGTDPPFLGMGEPGKPVSIWMWKAEREADLETAFQDIEEQYPNLGVDSYPNLSNSPLEQPTRHALTLKSDPTFVTGWGAGNIVSDPTYRRSAESLEAQGYGSLKVRPLIEQDVAATGRFDAGSYAVTYRRSLKAKDGKGITLRPGDTVSIGFAVWDGTAGDRDGKKSVTIWHQLKIQP